MRRIDNFIFQKSVKGSSTGMVVAEVMRTDRDTGEKLECVGQEFFSFIFDSQETKFEKAHKWADKQMEICEKYETGSDFYADKIN